MKKDYDNTNKSSSVKGNPTLTELMLKREFTGSNKIAKDNSPSIDSLENLTDDLPVSSSTDCTGLIPSAPQTDDELESYKQIQPSIFPENILP